MLILVYPSSISLGVVLLQKEDTAIKAQDFPEQRWIVIYYRCPPQANRRNLPGEETKQIQGGQQQQQPVMSFPHGTLPYDERFSVPCGFTDTSRLLQPYDCIVLSRALGQRIVPLPYKTLYLSTNPPSRPVTGLPQPMLCLSSQTRLTRETWYHIFQAVDVVAFSEPLPAWMAAALCAGCRVVLLSVPLQMDWLDYPSVGQGRLSSVLPSVHQTWNLKEAHTKSELDMQLCDWYEELSAANLHTSDFFWRILGYDTQAEWYGPSSFVTTAKQRDCVLTLAIHAEDTEVSATSPYLPEDDPTDLNE